MPFNQFNSNSEGSSFEQGNPLTKAVNKVAQSTGAAAVQQAKQAKQTFLDQLYGNVASGEEGVDDQGNPVASPQLPQTQNPQSSAIAQQAAHAKTPEEQKEIEETRKKLHLLQNQHRTDYYEKTFGEGEAARKKREQEAEQEEQMKLQEEQDKIEQEEAEKQRQEQGLQAMQSGKGNGRNRMSPPPLAVTQSQTKAESNRGTSG